MKRYASFVILFILMLGCTQRISQNTLYAKLDNEFELKINQTAFIENENIKIKFLNVTEDSRCPSDVVCVWEGQVTVVADILKSDKSLGNFIFISRDNNDSIVKYIDGYTIKLVKVEPYPKSTEKIENYFITMLVSKTNS